MNWVGPVGEKTRIGFLSPSLDKLVSGSSLYVLGSLTNRWGMRGVQTSWNPCAAGQGDVITLFSVKSPGGLGTPTQSEQDCPFRSRSAVA